MYTGEILITIEDDKEFYTLHRQHCGYDGKWRKMSLSDDTDLFCPECNSIVRRIGGIADRKFESGEIPSAWVDPDFRDLNIKKSVRKYTTISGEVNQRLEKYNKDHPEHPIDPSTFLDAMLDKRLKENGY